MKILSFSPFSPLLQTKLNDMGLLILRLWVGLTMVFAHGWPKLSSFSERSLTFSDPLGVGSTTSLTMTIFAEVVCALLIAVGFTTRLAAIPLVFAMVVAAFVVHADDPWQKQEFALLFAVPYLVLILTGPGKLSLDYLIFRKKDR